MILGSIEMTQKREDQGTVLNLGIEPPIIKNASIYSGYRNFGNNHSDNANNLLNILSEEGENYINREPSLRNPPHNPENGDEIHNSEIRGWRVLRKEYCWDRCPPDEKCPWFLHDKPLTLLVVVLGFNMVLSLIFANIFIELEGPPQKVSFVTFQY